MPCYSPLDAWRPFNSDRKLEKGTGSKKLVFVSSSRCAQVKPDLKVPCGQCVGCRLERSRQWAVRCVHESKLHAENCFITLTYDSKKAPPLDVENDQKLPSDISLYYRDFQLFMKRLRKRFPEKKIRFYMCGEYGENFGRPHFHACIFGHNFDDLVHWQTRNKVPLYRSKTLEELWPYGYSSVGTVTFESAAYVARYIMKKVTGEAAELHYTFRCGSFNRGDIKSPARVYSNVAQARACKRLVH